MSQLVRHRFDVEDFHRMAEAGVFGEDDRVELLEGEIVEMSPIGSRHAACVKRLNAAFAGALAGRAVVSVQDPIRLGPWSEPQPDVALLRPRADYYAGEHPGPADVLLVVEVAESSVDTDRRYKVPLYAAAGIPEVWLVDLVERRIDICTEPDAGGYRHVREAAAGDVIAPLTFAHLTMDVDTLLT